MCARVTRDPGDFWRSPICGCCGASLDHLAAAGFAPEVIETDDLAPVKERLGVRPALCPCHTAFVKGNAIEGHVPAPDILRLLDALTEAAGLHDPSFWPEL